MEEKKQQVLASEDAILRLGKEAERMSATNKLLEGVIETVRKSQTDVNDARIEIIRYSESASTMNKRTEELVTSLNSRYEALEMRLRGIDLELTSFRKGLDGIESNERLLGKNIESIMHDYKRTEQRMTTFVALLFIVLGASIVGIVSNFL